MNAVYQAATSWVGRRPDFECGENSLLFRSMKCNIQTVGKYFGWGQGQRRHFQIHSYRWRLIPDIHGMQSKGHVSSLFSFFSFLNSREFFGTVPYFCLVCRQSTSCLQTHTVFGSHLQLCDLCTDTGLCSLMAKSTDFREGQTLGFSQSS